MSEDWKFCRLLRRVKLWSNSSSQLSLWNCNHMQICGQIPKVLKSLRISPSSHDSLSHIRLSLQLYPNTRLGPKRETAIPSTRLRWVLKLALIWTMPQRIQMHSCMSHFTYLLVSGINDAHYHHQVHPRYTYSLSLSVSPYSSRPPIYIFACLYNVYMSICT